ncbi:response regulator transcription factor [Candidatus Methylomirabilis sp.]|uniref:response regulator n=1 Tax=Candidatus Methylomirabilis sp. TaxID=2032687 RepID=UPI002A67FE4E|nr:response regulator transcription factor [Candidatus Methylomirabilis sp.]
MRILIAEDSLVSRRLLEATLKRWGHEVITTSDGSEAWQVLEASEAPPLAILDWVMPKMDGPELCRRIRQTQEISSMYVILLTAKGIREDIVAGLDAGADDYLIKPFDPEELRARVDVGRRIVELQRSLADRVNELEEALSQVRSLRGLLPICAYCKKIRDDKSYWQEVEGYISRHSEAQFSHHICPSCYEKCVKPELERIESWQETGTALR